MAIHGLAPLYISDLISVRVRFSYNLRSNSTLFLEPPREKMLSKLSGRFFYATAPCLWINSPAKLHAIPSLTIFKCNHRTYLFGQVFLKLF